jgi:hypothetical protein
VRSSLTTILAAGLWLSGGAVAQNAERPRLRPVPKLDKNLKTGPAVGNRIPSFEVRDQGGRKRTFESIRGPKGALLMFVRSADW